VLNIITDHDFQDVFKTRQKRWEWCICAEWDYVRLEVFMAVTVKNGVFCYGVWLL
jgi:hypothetical protein